MYYFSVSQISLNDVPKLPEQPYAYGVKWPMNPSME